MNRISNILGVTAFASAIGAAMAEADWLAIALFAVALALIIGALVHKDG